jgi:pyruvate/2-oxoglutarate/acetoin dehydrogenase E1 component
MPSARETSGANRELSYLDAIREAQFEEMSLDETVVIMGEDVTSNFYGTTRGLADAFGPDRVIDTPLSEAGFVGAAIGAAMSGLRPIVDLEMAPFIYVAIDQLVSQAAKNRFMFGGQVQIPIVVRTAMFYGSSLGAQHSDRPYPMLLGVPGLKVVTPSNPTDAKYLLKAAIRDNNPVVIFEDAGLWGMRETVPLGDPEESRQVLSACRIARHGNDVTVVAVARMVREALRAAAILDGAGISVEVIDPRTLNPADWNTVFESVRRTGRLLAVDAAHRTSSFASECVARVAVRASNGLKTLPAILATPDVHPAFAPTLERDLYPTANSIVEACRELMKHRAALAEV